jgi:5-methyltetrahydrofolate--homocysteine methyltransferase
MQRMIDPKQRPLLLEEIQQEHQEMRKRYGEGQSQVKLLSLEEARANRFQGTWDKIEKPDFLGVRYETGDLAEIAEYIDWTPFFSTWELKGAYPRIFQDPVIGPRAQELFDDARRLLDEIIAGKQLQARAAYGFFAANSQGDDIHLSHEGRPLAVWPTLRQQAVRGEGQPNFALADFIAPLESGTTDYLGAFAVSSGFGLEELCQRFEANHDDYNSIMAKALADRLAEAYAELLHKKARLAWGYGRQEQFDIADLIKERYRGIRPAPGYPACPDHQTKRLLWKHLDVEAQSGIRLTESLAMWPGSSVCGFYFAHPESRYFAVGKLARDQVEDYAARLGQEMAEVERWLGPALSYEPDAQMAGAARG